MNKKLRESNKRNRINTNDEDANGNKSNAANADDTNDIGGGVGSNKS